jgi:hypothetical protein
MATKFWNVGQRVVTVKPTRHGIVPAGTVGQIVEVRSSATVEGEMDAVVEFAGQSMRFAFPIDKQIGTKIQIVMK